MAFIRSWFGNFTAFQILIIGYGLVTLTGAVLLSLPISSQTGTHQPFIDSLFMATSGISTTGLAVVDIGTYYNMFGQIVLLCVFQIGGIGYMSFLISFAYFMGLRLSFMTNIVAKESLSVPDYRTIGRFFSMVLIFTLAFEITGAFILTLLWMPQFPLHQAIYLGIFHSISTFCTAGFSLFSDSLIGYKTNRLINLTIIVVSITGGIGFIVLHDLYSYLRKTIKKQYPRKLSVHTKIVAVTTSCLMLVGTAIVFISEKWQPSTSFVDRIMISAFQAVSASTTDGFNTVDIGSMTSASLTFIMFLMFVGASPGSTGGGIKTSTLGLLLVFIWHQIREKEENISLFKRRIGHQFVYKAIGVFLWFFIIIVIDMIILSATEKASYLQILFETISAMGNTGLSTGITFSLTFIGKIILIITMFIGRVGPMATGFFFIGKQKTLNYEYAAEDIFVG